MQTGDDYTFVTIDNESSDLMDAVMIDFDDSVDASSFVTIDESLDINDMIAMDDMMNPDSFVMDSDIIGIDGDDIDIML